MVYKNLYVNSIIRIILIVITCYVLTYVYIKLNDWLIISNLIALLIIQLVLMINYFNKLNSKLDDFFSSVENDDVSFSIHTKFREKKFKKLVERLTNISSKIKNLRIENEKQNFFFKYVVENVNIGLLGIDKEGKVELINKALYEILNIKTISNISQLDDASPGIVSKLVKLNPDSQILIKMKQDGITTPISVKAKEYNFYDKNIKLFSFQNIKRELEEKELDSWQKMIRILTHEIMNSTGPIVSSIDTISDILKDESKKGPKSMKDIDDEMINDTLKGIQIIKERSIGLNDFVNNFRKLTVMPKLNIENLKLEPVFENIFYLFNNDFKKNKIQTEIEIYPAHLYLPVDRKLFEQVLINLIKNSIDGLKQIKNKKKIINLKAFLDYLNRVNVQVIDNGKGIDEQIIDQVFLPFFTTKENGSGIGLSWVKQIMKLHGGDVLLKSVTEQETIVTLIF